MTRSAAESLSAAAGREKVRQECRKGRESVEERRYHGVNEALRFSGVASSSLPHVCRANITVVYLQRETSLTAGVM